MNLDDYQIRTLLAPLYHEACFDKEINMVELAELLEYLAIRFKKNNAHNVWNRLNLDKTKYDKPTYLKYLAKLYKQYFITLSDFTMRQLHDVAANNDHEKAYETWIEEYTEALANWDSVVYAKLCEQFADLNKQEIENFKLLNYNILDGNWSAAIRDYLSLSRNEHLPKATRSSFCIYSSQIELYHILPDFEKALEYLNQALELDNNAKVQRAFGEFHLQKRDFEDARAFFMRAIEMDPEDLENYLFMGDCYRDEAKYETAEQWYDDALHLNFFDSGSYRRKIILYGYANDMASKKDEISRLITYLETIEFDHADENKICTLYRDIGYAYLLTRDYENAIVYYQKAIDNKPNLTLAYIDIAYMYVYIENFEDAEKNFLQAIKLSPFMFEANWGMEYFYAQTNEYDKAIHYLLKCLDLRPSQPESIYNKLGFNYEKIKDYTEAQKYYWLALELNPTSKVYYDALKSILENHGAKNDLLELLEFGINHAPQDPLQYNELGLFYFRDNEFEKAIEHFTHCIALNSKEPVYFENCGLAYERLQDKQNAEKMYREAIALEETSGIFHNRLGFFLNTIGDDQQALTYYKEAVRREPKKVLYLNNLGITYSRLKQWNDAVKIFSEVLKIDEQNVLANSELGFAYYWLYDLDKGLSDLDKAELYLEKALMIEPENPARYNDLAFIYQKKFDYQKALDLYNKAIELDPDNDGYNNWAGIMNFYLNNYSEAITCYNKAIAINPNIPQYYENLGLVYDKIKVQQSADEA